MRTLTDEQIQAIDFRTAEYKVTRESIPYHLISAPDPGWRHTTKCGTEHKWEGNPLTVSGARWKVLIPATDEYPEHGEWRCVKCRQRIHPGTREENGYIAGVTDYFLNGERITEEDAKSIREFVKNKTKRETLLSNRRLQD